MIKKQGLKPKFKPIARGGWSGFAIRGLGYIDCKIMFLQFTFLIPCIFKIKFLNNSQIQ